MKYFAYGSNMSLKRLAKRIPSAKRIGLYQLKGHQLRFHKHGSDGSGKCDAFHTNDPQDIVHGALFDIDQTDKAILDKIEGVGKGYDIKAVYVQQQSQQQVQAFTYIATHIVTDLQPFSWYLNHVIIGAKEIAVPAKYLKAIINTPSITDSDSNRDKRNRALY